MTWHKLDAANIKFIIQNNCKRTENLTKKCFNSGNSIYAGRKKGCQLSHPTCKSYKCDNTHVTKGIHNIADMETPAKMLIKSQKNNIQRTTVKN